MKRTFWAVLIAVCIIIAAAIQTAFNKRARLEREHVIEQIESSVPAVNSTHSS